jgi:hypothetical protein
MEELPSGRLRRLDGRTSHSRLIRESQSAINLRARIAGMHEFVHAATAIVALAPLTLFVPPRFTRRQRALLARSMVAQLTIRKEPAR